MTAPIYPGHQVLHPHPDIGYYDFLETSVRAQQAQIAKKYGVFGFCYHTYWFNGVKLMQEGLEKLLRDGEPDIPFCFHWANESWSRSWDGLEKNILQAQTYGGVEDWNKHFQYWLPFFKHRNYIKFENRPVVVLYRIRQIPEFETMLEHWQQMAKDAGFAGLHVLMMLNIFVDGKYDTDLASSIQGVVQYEPNNAGFLLRNERSLTGELTKVDIQHAWTAVENSPKHPITHYRGTFPAWDNSPRRMDKAIIFSPPTREQWKNHLRRMFIKAAEEADYKPTYFFLNAWNEWAEGCAFEPSLERGYEFLGVLSEILKESIPAAN